MSHTTKTAPTLIGLVVLWASLMGWSVEAAEAPTGQELFVSLRCNMCHSVSSAEIEAKAKSEKMRAKDLVDLEDDAESLKQYILREVERDGVQHKAPFKGEPAELDAIITWLLEQHAADTGE